MSFSQQIAARQHRDGERPEPTVFDPSAALRNARAATPPRAWAQRFFEGAENTGLPLATLNEIVASSATLAEAEGKIARHLAAGAGHAGLRKPAQADAATRISAAHAKAHGPRRKDHA